MLDKIRIILVGTTHSGNIGSSARALKTMGLSNLYLVAPKVMPDEHSIALACGGKDIIDTVKIVERLEDAICDCNLVIGASARSRGYDWPILSPKDASVEAIKSAHTGNVAIVFGRENNGLTNTELQLCNYHLQIDANPEYSSLNLAQAVQIICYELRVASIEVVNEVPIEYPLNSELEGFFLHLERCLLKTGFIVKKHPGQIMSKLRRLFSRRRIEIDELNILRGILTSVERDYKED